jgi:hypothetical protein
MENLELVAESDVSAGENFMVEKYGKRIRKTVQDGSHRGMGWRPFTGNCGEIRRRLQNRWYMRAVVSSEAL